MLTLLVASILLLAFSGIPPLLARGAAGERWSTALVLAGSAGGLAAAVSTLVSGEPVAASAPWSLPGAAFALRLDPLAAAFLLPLFVLGALASVYGLAYWPGAVAIGRSVDLSNDAFPPALPATSAAAHRVDRPAARASSARLRLFTGVLLAGMASVIVAAHAILFLVAWEAMAVAAFFLVAAEDEDREARSAAWLYLVATHAGTLFLLALFSLFRSARGTFLLGPLDEPAAPLLTSILFLLALAGFGFKAGIVPLHFWLPGAHASAPSHVSALLSGAMLKVGIYGIVRTLTFLPEPPLWWGWLLVTAGLVSALTAIALALLQSDLKRALAYSSIENVGIIVMALGLWTTARSSGSAGLAALGLAGAVAHVWNHSLFKGLLFLGAGSVVHATGTRRMERLGGLLQRMPVTGAALVAGAAAAAALPATNAFVSEWLIYAGFFREAGRGSLTSLAVVGVALTGALAVVCFVRLTGMTLLGSGRSEPSLRAHEAPLLMRVPLIVLALACIGLGVVPAAIAPALETVAGVPGAVSPLLGSLAVPLPLVAGATALAVAGLLASARRSPRRPTWDCGYAAPSSRMQYTPGSLSEWLTSRLLPSFLRPSIRRSGPEGLLPRQARMDVTTDEPVADRILLPLAARWGDRAMRLRWMQQGRLPVYLVYIFVTLLAGVAWVVIFPLLGGTP